MHKKILVITAMLSIMSATAFADPISGIYKLVNETITNPDPACPNIENSGIYIGNDPTTDLRYDANAHTLNFNSPKLSFTIPYHLATDNKYELALNHLVIQGKVTMTITSPLTGNNFDVTLFSDSTVGGVSQRCTNAAHFELAS